MSQAVSQGPDVRDTYTIAGDIIPAHDPAVAQGYKDAAQEAIKRGPGRVIKSTLPSAPLTAPLPSPIVARQVANRESNRLRAVADAGRRDLAARFTFGASGQQISDPAVLMMRGELVAQIDATAAEADRLGGLDDAAVARWAYDHGVR